MSIIRAWSNALRRGDVRGAAHYFAVPSVMVNGSGAGAALISINSYADAVAANASLPCGALFVSADQRGRYVNAVFRLTQRPGTGGGGCGSGVGLTARTNFVIADGRIQQWIRAPDEPGDAAARRATKPREPGGAQPPVVTSAPVV